MTTKFSGNAQVLDDSGSPSQAFRDFLRKVGEGTDTVGDYKQSARPDLGDGWLHCDGTAVAVATYPELAKVLAPITSGDSVNFELPKFDDDFTDANKDTPVRRTWIKAR